MQKLVFVNGNNESINLTAGDFGITNWAGLSNAELNLQTQQVPYQDGSVFIDALLNNREISVTLAINDGNNLYKRYQLKRKVISALNPKLGEGYLYYTNDFYSRRIKCVPQLPVFENKNSNDSGTLKASLVFIACGVYWEDIEEAEVFINSNESKIIDIDTDVETSIKAWFTDGADNASLDINGRSVSIESVENPCMLETSVGEKKFTSYEMSLLMDSVSVFYAGFLDGYYYFAGGYTAFGQNSESSYLFRTKDFKEYEIVDLNLGNALIYGMGVNEAINFGIIVTTTSKIFCFKNGTWIEISYSLNGAVSCAVLPSEYPDVLVVGADGTLYHNTDTECTQWEAVNSSHHYYSVKAREFTINGVDYIALVSDGSYVYGIDASFNAVQLFSVSNSYSSYDYVNGYFYDFMNDRRSADLSEWEDLSIIVSDTTIGHLETLVYNGSVWVGVIQTGFIVSSTDGINFSEFKKLNPSRLNYTGYFAYDDRHGNDILVMGKSTGIESYYKGSLLMLKPSFSYRCFNKNGTLEISGNKAYIDGEAITLPVTPSFVTCNDEVFVIMDSASHVYSSTDGKTWVLKGQVYSSGTNAKKICFIKSLGVWVAISSGLLFQSHDLITWEIMNAGSNLVDVAECDGLMVAITENGRFITYDGNVLKYYFMASGESGITRLCVAEEIGKILALADGKIYKQNIRNMRFIIGAAYWTKITTGFAFSGFVFMENYSVYFCKDTSTKKILRSADLRTWTEFLQNPQNADIVYDEEDMFLNTSDSVGILSTVHEENAIDKIQGDLNLSLAKNNVIIYKNEKPSILRLVYRNKYIGV